MALNFLFTTRCSNEQLKNVLLLCGFQDKCPIEFVSSRTFVLLQSKWKWAPVRGVLGLRESDWKCWVWFVVWSSLNSFSRWNKARINAISTLSNLVAELSLFTTRYTCCFWKALDVLCLICTQLHPGHLSVCVGDSSWCSEETLKILNCVFQCDYYYYYYYYYYYSLVCFPVKFLQR